ncbi:MAG: DUF3576 domain-containing protein [Elsteraceae bacterium]
MKTTFTASLLALAVLAGCGGKQEFFDPAVERPRVAKQIGYASGEGGWNIVGGDSKKGEEGGAGIGVNSFLWRASLDTLAFMPLASADPFGGVIITDWYATPAQPNDRFKVTVYILDRQLRADGLRAAVFRQTRDNAGNWADVPADPRTGVDMENAILTRAREMRISMAGLK